MQEYKLNNSRNRLIVSALGVLLISIPIYKMTTGEDIHKPFIGMITLGAVLIYLGIFGFKKKQEINKKEILAIDALISVGIGIVVYVVSGSLEASLIIGVALILYSLRVLAY